MTVGSAAAASVSLHRGSTVASQGGSGRGSDRHTRSPGYSPQRLVLRTSVPIEQNNSKASKVSKLKKREEKIAALKAAKEGPTIETIKLCSEQLSAEISKIGEHMAKAGQQAAGGANGSQPGGANPGDGKGSEGGDNVKDAEFKEKK